MFPWSNRDGWARNASARDYFSSDEKEQFSLPTAGDLVTDINWVLVSLVADRLIPGMSNYKA